MLSGSKIFGIPFDPPTSPERLDIKHAYLSHIRRSGDGVRFPDPYDFAYHILGGRFPSLPDSCWHGKMEIDSWLTPTPRIDDSPLLSSGLVDLFLESNGCRRHMEDVRGFVEEYIFPCRPFSIGIDHCSTGGSVMALAKQFPDLNVIILDSHFDVADTPPPGPGASRTGSLSPSHCGNFLLPLLEEGVIRPENLWVLGVNAGLLSRNGAGTGSTAPGAAEWVKRGVHLLSKSMLPSGLDHMLLTGPVYLSIDVDIGSLSSVFSARFMNCYGLDRTGLLGLLGSVNARIAEAHLPLVGMDLMELDVHFLGASSTLAFNDCTEDLFLKSFEIFLDHVHELTGGGEE